MRSAAARRRIGRSLGAACCLLAVLGGCSGNALRDGHLPAEESRDARQLLQTGLTGGTGSGSLAGQSAPGTRVTAPNPRTGLPVTSTALPNALPNDTTASSNTPPLATAAGLPNTTPVQQSSSLTASPSNSAFGATDPNSSRTINQTNSRSQSEQPQNLRQAASRGSPPSLPAAILGSPPAVDPSTQALAPIAPAEQLPGGIGPSQTTRQRGSPATSEQGIQPDTLQDLGPRQDTAVPPALSNIQPNGFAQRPLQPQPATDTSSPQAALQLAASPISALSSPPAAEKFDGTPATNAAGSQSNTLAAPPRLPVLPAKPPASATAATATPPRLWELQAQNAPGTPLELPVQQSRSASLPPPAIAPLPPRLWELEAQGPSGLTQARTLPPAPSPPSSTMPQPATAAAPRPPRLWELEAYGPSGRTAPRVPAPTAQPPLQSAPHPASSTSARPPRLWEQLEAQSPSGTVRARSQPPGSEPYQAASTVSARPPRLWEQLQARSPSGANGPASLLGPNGSDKYAPSAMMPEAAALPGPAQSPANRNNFQPAQGPSARRAPAPGPALANATRRAPAPGPQRNGTPVPSPAARLAPGAPAPARGPAVAVPAPGPARSPAATVPVPGPATGPAATAPAPGPGRGGLLATAPAPEGPASAPVPAPEAASLAPRPGPAQAPLPTRPVPVPAPSQQIGPAPTPGQAAVPRSASTPAPMLLAESAPGQAPSLTPASAPGALGAASVLAPGQPASAPGALSPGATAPGAGVGGAAQTPAAATAGGQLSPAQSPQFAQAPLAQIFPASNLPPAAPGQAATLVTVPQNAESAGATVTVRDSQGIVRPANPQDVTSDATLFARPGSLSLIVQSSTPLPELPASAVGIQGGTVTSTSPVPGSNGRLFNVGVTTAAGVSFLTVATVAGIGLGNGLTTQQSNTIRINLQSTSPMPVITSGARYASGQTVSPGFTIDFGKQVVETNPQRLYTLTGVDRTDVLYDYGNGRIFIEAFILPEEAGTARLIEITVPAGVTTDDAGNPNTGATYSYRYTPPSPGYTTVSTVTNSISGAAIGVAVVAPIAAGVGTAAAATPAAGATAAAGTFSALHILSALQLTYLSGQMNVANLPDNFRQVANSFSYTVLNFRMPWENAHSNSIGDAASTGFPSQPAGISVPGMFGPPGQSEYFSMNTAGQTAGRRRLAQSTSASSPALAPVGARNGTITVPNIAGGSSQYVVTSTGLNQTEDTAPVSVAMLGEQVQSTALGDGNNPYETLWRALFWLGFGLVAITLLVWAIVAFILYMRWEVPIILQEPRPQFMLLLFAVPAIAQACAQLFGGDGKAIAVGVVIVVVFPVLMVFFGIFFVWRNIMTRNRRRAAWVLADDPELSERGKPSWWSRVLDVIVGPKGVEGGWVAIRTRDSKFVNQYGPLFEVNRGPPMVLTDVTYEVDPVTGHCNRGRLQQVYEAPLLKLGRLKLYPHHLQSHNSSVELLHMLGSAILLQAFTSPNSYPQVILLIVINVAMLTWLRIIRPNGDRTELIMAMIGVLSSTGVYICGLILLANPDGSPDFRNRVGIAMIVLGLWSVVTFIVSFIAFVVTTWDLWSRFYLWLCPSKDNALKFAKVVYAVMEKDDHILARKYADRWLYKTLGTGLHGREVFRREIKDPRRKLYDTVLLANLTARGKALPGAKRAGLKQGLKVASDSDDATLPVVSQAANKWMGLKQVGVKPPPSSTGRTSPHSGSSSSSTPGTQRFVMNHNPIYTQDDTFTSGSESEGARLRDRKRHPAAPSAAAASPLGARENVQSGRDDLVDIIMNPYSITRGRAAEAAPAPPSAQDDDRIPLRGPPLRRATWSRRAAGAAEDEKENV